MLLNRLIYAFCVEPVFIFIRFLGFKIMDESASILNLPYYSLLCASTICVFVEHFGSKPVSF